MKKNYNYYNRRMIRRNGRTIFETEVPEILWDLSPEQKKALESLGDKYEDAIRFDQSKADMKALCLGSIVSGALFLIINHFRK